MNGENAGAFFVETALHFGLTRIAWSPSIGAVRGYPIRRISAPQRAQLRAIRLAFEHQIVAYLISHRMVEE
jgi:hypothetical protein